MATAADAAHGPATAAAHGPDDDHDDHPTPGEESAYSDLLMAHDNPCTDCGWPRTYRVEQRPFGRPDGTYIELVCPNCGKPS